ncbi:MAG TPA: hypothetical protein VGC49_05500 [Solirubrobacterales bacterium]|jgi:hypothetical protein
MPSVKLGLIVTPAIDQDVAEAIRDELREALTERYPEVSWEIDLVRDPLAPPPVHLTELVSAARDRLLAEDWDLAVGITELPLRLSHRPLLSHASRTHGVGLVSLPALGVVQRRRRLQSALLDAIATLIGDRSEDGRGRRSPAARLGVERRLAELASDVDDDPDAQGVAFLARVLSGNLRLLVGMVGANHPWRLVSHLWRAMLGAVAALVFALVQVELWPIATTISPIRLAIPTLGSIVAAAIALIIAHGLWERAPEPRVREQVALFNLATTFTVVFGVTALYLSVFLISLTGAVVMIEPSFFAKALGQRDVSVWDYLRLAWLASSLGTIGGALGATLETDETVREAAYAYLPGVERRPAPTGEAPDRSAVETAERS